MLSACQNFESRGYRVTAASHSDSRKVARILRSVAGETGLQKRSPTPYDSPVIALYKAPEVDLRACVERGDVRVSVSRYKWPASAAFSRADALLRADLSREFGQRFTVEPQPQVTRTITVH
jgi:hypothetical protein